MELKLNIYKDDGTVEKTYEAQDFVLMTGTCEDILATLDMDELMKKLSDQKELGRYILDVIVSNLDKFKPYVFRVFPGLTEDEYRRTAFREVGIVIVKIAMYTINELFAILGVGAKKGKNQ